MMSDEVHLAGFITVDEVLAMSRDQCGPGEDTELQDAVRLDEETDTNSRPHFLRQFREQLHEMLQSQLTDI